jgi:hypothetical protein
MACFLPSKFAVAAFAFSTVLVLQGSVSPAAEPSGANTQSPIKKTVAFEDGFERENLGEQYEIWNPDPNRLILSNGKLIIVGATPITNWVLLKKALDNNFVITVETKVALSQNNAVALNYFVDEQNRLALGVAGIQGCQALPWTGPGGFCSGPRRQPFFTKVLEGQLNNIVEPMKNLDHRNLDGYQKNPETWYFQLRRDGVRYTGLISVDGTRWSKIGSHVIVNKNGQVGLNVSSGGGIETAAEFDNLVIQE